MHAVRFKLRCLLLQALQQLFLSTHCWRCQLTARRQGLAQSLLKLQHQYEQFCCTHTSTIKAFSQAEEELAAHKLTPEEAQRRRDALAKNNALLFYQEQKAKRVKKIKSKAFHRHLKKQNEKARARLGTDSLDPAAAQVRFRSQDDFVSRYGTACCIVCMHAWNAVSTVAVMCNSVCGIISMAQTANTMMQADLKTEATGVWYLSGTIKVVVQAQAEEDEFRRARERLTLKHRNTSRWARRALRRGLSLATDEQRDAIHEQLRLGRELKAKAATTRNGSDSDERYAYQFEH